MEDQHAASHRLSMAQLQTMEFKQAFEEFDKVTKLAGVILTKKRSFAIIRPWQLFEGSKWDNINERAAASHEVDGAKPDRGRGGFRFLDLSSFCLEMGRWGCDWWRIVIAHNWSRKPISVFASNLSQINRQVLSLVIEYDVNGNGKLDFDEFMEMMRKQVDIL